MLLAPTFLTVQEWRDLQEAALLRIKQANVNVLNVASPARKDLSRLTCFNSDVTRQVSRAKEG